MYYIDAIERCTATAGQANPVTPPTRSGTRIRSSLMWCWRARAPHGFHMREESDDPESNGVLERRRNFGMQVKDDEGLTEVKEDAGS